jgi:hypothetical protein
MAKIGRFLVPALVAASCVACGDERPRGATTASAASRAIDRSTPEATVAAAHAALAAGDLAGLEPYMTEAAMRRLTDDLAAWRSFLVDPVSGPRVASRIPLGDRPDAAATAERALRTGDPAALLRLYVSADPRAPLPPTAAAPRDAGATTAEVEVPARDGERRLVRLVRTADGWRIDHLPL